MVRLLTCFLVTLAACRSADFTDELRVAVQPRILKDDGARARVSIATNDRYGEAGVGTVHVASTAGSLRDGIDLVLDASGEAETTLTCVAKDDPDCHDIVTVTATWKNPQAEAIAKHVDVTVTTTDAFVSACAFQNRRVLKLISTDPPSIQLAVLDTNPQVAHSTNLMATWDPGAGVGAISLTQPSQGAEITDEEQLVRAAFGPGVGNPLVQTFTTWDGFSAVRSNFDLDVTADLKAELQTIATALGAGTVDLSGSADTPGPFKVELLVVRHDGNRSAIVIGLHAAATFVEGAMFDLEDVAGGSALAFATDLPVDPCEIFTVQSGKKVDFLWVVDDSCSMQSSQTAVATVGASAANRIQGALLDFRAGGVSTGYYPPAYDGSRRLWTDSIPAMLSWFRAGTGGWGTFGSGSERGFAALSEFMKGAPGTEFRTDAEVHIIFLSDTRDQSSISAAQMKAALDAKFPKQHVVVSGIVCPEGEECGDMQREDPVGKYHTLIRQTGGVLGSIKVFNPRTVTPQLLQQQADTMDRIVGTVVNGAGYGLQYRPITASVRVASSGTVDPRCDNRDIPRSRDDGWDLDPATGHIAFYGKCVPQLGGTMVVSYKSWARYGTQIHESTTPVYAVPAPAPVDAGVDAGFFVDGGMDDGGVDDAGVPDAGADGG